LRTVVGAGRGAEDLLAARSLIRKIVSLASLGVPTGPFLGLPTLPASSTSS
jgi:hypothetical protein